MLRIFNSLTRDKADFKPIEPGKVRMYVCGITVYDYVHLGHARMMLVFDMVVRYLRARGLKVTYVRNITDIDDKIIKRAAENGESIDQLTARFIDAMYEDADALGMLRPDQEPRATGHIPDILDMIRRLVDKGLAYQGKNGDVYYDVSKFPGYGRLSNKNPEDLRAGARVEINESKDDPLDFVLWKAAKPGEPQWDSPWGAGRPGWHIECSAMSTACLGNHFDIHGGGQDLQFPHHENEIAQSEGATGEHFVNVWMHNGFIRVQEEKMSKSLGNFFTVRDILKLYAPEVVRFFILTSHYRSPLNYSNENLDEAKASLARLYTALRGTQTDGVAPDAASVEEFNVAMDDDFNSHQAIVMLHRLAGELNRIDDKQSDEAKRLAATMRHLGGVLGLLQDDPDAFLKSAPADGELTPAEIEAYIEQRAEARRNRDFKEADRIRDLLTAKGVVLEDNPDGTGWRRA